VKCGDTIIAAASTGYSATNFASGEWGTVTCPAGNNLAWLKCATFDGCKIGNLAPLANGMTLSTSYWGVQGWEVEGTSASGPCFQVYPPGNSTIHHIVLANDIAIGCGLNGFASASSGKAGVDYLAVVGSIAYNATGGSAYCGSGISVWEPVASDSLPGTHIYIAGNFSWGNVNGDPCNGMAPSDGEGIVFDTFDGNTTRIGVYSQQAVVDNNILVANGGPGLEVFSNSKGTGPFSHIYFRSNTAWGNNSDPHEAVPAYAVAEILVYIAQNVNAFRNIAATNAKNGARSQPIYAFSVNTSNGTTQIYKNWGYAASGTYGGTSNSTAFSYSPSNLFGTDPGFVNARAPDAPSCGSASSVPNCMTMVITNFTPTAPGASAYGYQIPSTTQVYDPLFPKWLCNVNLPAGLVTMGCLTGSTVSPGGALNGVSQY